MNLSDYKDVYVFAEQRNGKLQNVALELLGKARELADANNEKVVAMLLGKDVKALAPTLIEHGADRVMVVDHDLLKDYMTEPYTEAITAIIESEKPSIMLIGATTIGRDLGPRVSARNRTGLTADATKLEISDDEAHEFRMTRPAFGGNLMATILCKNNRPQMSTVRPGVMQKMAADKSRKGEVVDFKVNFDEKKIARVKLVKTVKEEKAVTDISEAKILVSGGRGVGTKDGFGKLEALAKELGGEVTTFNLARMNMLLHGLHDSEFEIFHGDTLTNDWPMLKDSNPVKPVTFDAVVANPPFSLKWEPDDETSNDLRFKNYGVAPKSAADFAFLLHGFHYLSDSGTMAIILPHGVLFRGGAEATIRQKLIHDDNIDCIIGLPSNLFYSTGIPVCIIVLKKCRKSDDVLFINAAECYEKDKKQNVLRPEHIDKIVETYRDRKEEDRYSRRVSLKEIQENDYNLNITRYVSLAQEEAQIDLAANQAKLKDIGASIKVSTEKLNVFLKELGLEEIQ